MPEDPPSSPALRASDADRDRVIELLHAALADGRLDAGEFDERVEAALAARTLEALVPLTADLVARSGSSVALPSPSTVASGAAGTELVSIREKHGTVRRDGRWTLPHRLALRTKWSGVLLDLTEAVRTGPELVIEMRVRGGSVELLLAPGMVVDANGLEARFSELAIRRDAGDGAAETLTVRLVGRIKYGGVTTRWQSPRG